MTRQAVTKHLVILGQADLVVPLWRGREKLHFFNPVPLKKMAEGWLAKFPKSCARALGDLEKSLDTL